MRLRATAPASPPSTSGGKAMPNQTMFFCVPQAAYMLVESCRSLRSRPVGKTPGGMHARPVACQNCTLHPRVDALDLPTVTLANFVRGMKPAAPSPHEE
jgi:hypothetical protein